MDIGTMNPLDPILATVDSRSKSPPVKYIQ